MNQKIEESDAVVIDEETGKPRFKTTEINIRPLGNRKNEILWALAMTFLCTGLVAMWFYFLDTT